MVPVRVCGVFRRVDHTSGAPARNFYPVVKPAASTELPRTHPFLDILDGGSKRCGRHKHRQRRTHRPSFQFSPSNGLRLGTCNCQGLQWNLTLHAGKLKALVEVSREHHFDAMLVSDLHYTDMTVHVVYVEEFCLVARGAVGVFMKNNLSRAWEAAGRPVFSVDDSSRVLGIRLAVNGRALAFVSVYTPAGGDLGAKRAHYSHARALHAQLQAASLEQVWAGDWNGHIGVSDGDGPLFGHHGLATPTSAGGRVLKEFAAQVGLAHVDSHRHIRCRGTWRHPINKCWYELDGFLISPSLLHTIQQRMFSFSLRGMSDHNGKAMHLHVGTPAAHSARQKRRSRMQHIRVQQQQQIQGQRIRCQHSLLQGNSAAAARLRTEYQNQVTQQLVQHGAPPIPPAAPITPAEGWTETVEGVWHMYTDGSFVSDPPAAGWGVCLWVDSKRFDLCGPVTMDALSLDFIGADRLSNNTGELSAIVHGMQQVLVLAQPPSELVIHYDSSYAAEVTQGTWNVRTNFALVKHAQKLLHVLREKCTVTWAWIRGHTGNEGNEAADSLANQGRQGVILRASDLPDSSGYQHQADLPSVPRITRRLTSKTPVRTSEPELTSVPGPCLEWGTIATLLTDSVNNLTGPTCEARRGAPLSPADKRRAAEFDKSVADAWESVRLCQATPQEPERLQEWRLAKRRRKDFLKKARSRFVKHSVSRLTLDLQQHDWGRFYQHLRQLGVSMEGVDFTGATPFSLAQLREHNMKISRSAIQVDLEVIDRAVPQRTTCDLPTWFEFQQALRAVRESAPGKDGVSIGMIKHGGELLQQQVYRTICLVWDLDATAWPDALRTGLGIALFKSGDRQDLDNWRTIVLLPMVSRLIGRVLSRRIMAFGEQRQLFSSTQFGNRKHRSVQDALFIVRTVLELAAEVAHRPGVTMDADHALTVLLFDIRKAFPSICRSALFRLCSRLGMPPRLVRLLEALHSGTRYQAATSEGLSAFYELSSGLREGCSTSPCLYTLYHDHAMRAFADKVAELRSRNPDFFVELHAWRNKKVNRRMNRTYMPSVQRLAESQWPLRILQMLEITYADDSTLICRNALRAPLESLLSDSLGTWGEVIKENKTKRICVSAEAVPEGFVPEARLLGGILSHQGHYQPKMLRA